MENNYTTEQIQALIQELENTKSELEKAKQERLVIEQPRNVQDKTFENIIEKAGPIVMQIMSMTIENEQYKTDRDVELEKEEIKIINKLDTKEKLFRGLMLLVCIIALIFSSMYLQKAEVVIPVLTLIIGLLFKTNTLNDFFSHVKGKLSNNDD